MNLSEKTEPFRTSDGEAEISVRDTAIRTFGINTKNLQGLPAVHVLSRVIGNQRLKVVSNN